MTYPEKETGDEPAELPRGMSDVEEDESASKGSDEEGDSRELQKETITKRWSERAEAEKNKVFIVYGLLGQ